MSVAWRVKKIVLCRCVCVCKMSWDEEGEVGVGQQAGEMGPKFEQIKRERKKRKTSVDGSPKILFQAVKEFRCISTTNGAGTVRLQTRNT